MKKTWVIWKKETLGYARSPLPYVLFALVFAVTAIFFMVIAYGQKTANTQWIPGIFSFLLLFVTPLITMRLVAEENNQGTLELLLTSPVRESEVVLGKLLGALTLYLSLFALSLVFPLILFFFGTPEKGPLLAQYLGLVLVSCAFVSVGLFASSVTRNQVIAAVAGYMLLFWFWVSGFIGQADFMTGKLGTVLQATSLEGHLQNFEKGVIDAKDLFFYLAFIATFTMLALFLMEARRWGEFAKATKLLVKAGVLVAGRALGVDLDRGRLPDGRDFSRDASVRGPRASVRPQAQHRTLLREALGARALQDQPRDPRAGRGRRAPAGDRRRRRGGALQQPREHGRHHRALLPRPSVQVDQQGRGLLRADHRPGDVARRIHPAQARRQGLDQALHGDGRRVAPARRLDHDVPRRHALDRRPREGVQGRRVPDERRCRRADRAARDQGAARPGEEGLVDFCPESGDRDSCRVPDPPASGGGARGGDRPAARGDAPLDPAERRRAAARRAGDDRRDGGGGGAGAREIKTSLMGYGAFDYQENR